MAFPRRHSLAEALAREFWSSDQVDPLRIASSLGVTVERRAMGPSVLGATPSAVRIVVNQMLGAREAGEVIAHELAHVLVKRGRAAFRDPSAEERFADAFALALLHPPSG